MLLENLRFHNEEKAGDEAFAKKLAAYGDIYCNNAFGTCHREHASMVAVPENMKGKPRVAGSLVDQEIRYLSDTLKDPKRPFVVVLGGAKVSDKLPAIENLARKADHILVGGAMAYTFLKAQGVAVGASRVEEEMLEDAKKAIAYASDHDCEIHLPADHVCSTTFDEKTGDNKTFTGDIGEGFMGLDIGPDTRSALRERDPGGEDDRVERADGRVRVGALRDRDASDRRGDRGATDGRGGLDRGGRDSASAASKFGVDARLSHVSTGGGASLEMLSGKPFRSVELLDETRD